MSATNPVPPRVFISYSHDSTAHEERVFQLSERLRADGIDARIDAHRLRTGKLTEKDWARLAKSYTDLSQARIFIDDSATITPLEMRAKCRRLKAEHNLGLIVVDYLQLVTSAGRVENRQQEIAMISRSLKSLARELNVPIIAVSQLNRGVEAREDKRPRLGDLRESGAVEQDADVVMFIYRDEYYFPEKIES